MQRLVVMGVSGSGKSTVAAGLAVRLSLPFRDGDDFHGPANVAKMRAGVPLTDADREPWLAAIAQALADESAYPGGLVVACSALKKAYRQRLRRAGGVRFVFLAVPMSMLEQRLRARSGHFMPASLLASQLQTLERPEADEADVCTVDAGGPMEAVVDAALQCLSAKAGLLE
jgi:gluconokinase